MMSREAELRKVGCVTGVQDLRRGRAADGGQRFVVDRESTVGPGVERTPDPVASHACGTWNPRRGPGGGLSSAGRPTVREAETLGGNRMPKKRMPAAERRQEGVSTKTGPPLVACR